MKNIRQTRVPLALGLSAMLIAGLAACTSAPSDTENGKTVLTVGDRPSADQAASRAVFDKLVKSFEKENPDIVVKPSATAYSAQTFQTLLAGGNLPNVLQIPFTEPGTLIQRNQLADITAQVKEVGLDTELNPTTLKIVQNDGKTYGVPTGAFAVGLNYNRDLFTQAGLDPDQPPQTWDEVREDAKIIAEKTGQTGYAQMSSNNCGGWMFTAMTYAYGGTLENEAGTKATFADTDGAVDALKLIHDMKWTDNSMGEQNLYDCGTILQDFAAGKIGMYLKAPDDYTNTTVQYGMSPDAFGAAGMPTVGDDERTTLTGGSVAVVSPKSTDKQKLAAVKWIQYRWLNQYIDQDAAVKLAEANKADNAPVAVPGLSVVSEDQYKTYFDWVAPYNNVPVDNFAPYISAQQDQKIVPEPKNSAQKVYAALDSLIQTVLTDQNADIPSLVKDAQERVTTQLGQ